MLGLMGADGFGSWGRRSEGKREEVMRNPPPGVGTPTSPPLFLPGHPCPVYTNPPGGPAHSQLGGKISQVGRRQGQTDMGDRSSQTQRDLF